MKSPSLDSFYHIYKKITKLFPAYTEIPELYFIIKACRLKPYGLIFEKNTDKFALHRHWFDEYRSSLKVLKDKKIKIIYNDLSLNKDNISYTDLYCGLSINNIIKISKLIYVCHGKDEDLNQDCVILSMLGIDNYLRTYLYLYGQWQQVSSLLLGFNNLKFIAGNCDIKYFQEIVNKDCKMPCGETKTWLSFLPASKEFMSVMNKQCGVVYSVFNGDNKE